MKSLDEIRYATRLFAGWALIYHQLADKRVLFIYYHSKLDFYPEYPSHLLGGISILCFLAMVDTEVYKTDF